VRRLLSVCAAVAVAALTSLGAPAHAVATPTECDQQPVHQTLLTSPVIVQIGVAAAPPTWDHVSVCVGTNGGAADGLAYQVFGVSVHPFGSLGPAACNAGGVPDQYTGIGLGTSTYGGPGANEGGGVSTSPQVCANGDGTYTIALPVLLCVGPCELNTGQTVGKTGLVVGTFGPAPAPPGTTGAGLAVYGFSLYADGIPVNFGPSQYDAVGVDPGAITPRTGTAVACGPLNLVCVPGAAGLYYDGGPILGVALTGVGTTYVTVPGGPRCLPVFQVAPSAPAC
jgi:hypothetical protein